MTHGEQEAEAVRERGRRARDATMFERQLVEWRLKAAREDRAVPGFVPARRDGINRSNEPGVKRGSSSWCGGDSQRLRRLVRFSLQIGLFVVM